MTLKTRFTLACASAGLTQAAWGISNGVSPSTLANVLAGKGKSKRATALIADFTAKQLAILAKELADAA